MTSDLKTLLILQQLHFKLPTQAQIITPPPPKNTGTPNFTSKKFLIDPTNVPTLYFPMERVPEQHQGSMYAILCGM